MRRTAVFLVSALSAGLGAAGCGDDSAADDVTDVVPDEAPDDAAVDEDVDGSETDADVADDDGGDGEADGAIAPGESFDRFCRGADWTASTAPATAGALSGDYAGVYSAMPRGTLLIMKFVPEHPFHLTTIRAAFAGPSGPIRIRLGAAFGRSVPRRNPVNDLTPAIDADLIDPDHETWVELDVTDRGIFLEPTQHYVVFAEQQSGGPNLAVETLPATEWSRALILQPGDDNSYGVDGNFRLELVGETFCRWDEADRWFEERADAPWADENTHQVAIVDLDGDLHDDLVVRTTAPRVFLGDGLGTFAETSFDAFPDAPAASLLVFGDLDNDGDADAFAGVGAGPDVDGDADGSTRADGDCNDADGDVHPGAAEALGNGIDDDCDTVADDGTDTLDLDVDGYAVADGDCDDTSDAVFPDATEANDLRDNDCDGAVDEDFVNRILLNDGTGRLSVLDGAGVEALDHSTAAALGDGNGDGVLDVYWGNWLILYPEDPATQDRYFEGVGDGTFVDAQAAAGLVLPTPYSCYGVLWNDYDNDGFQDIFVGNYHMYPNQLWDNRGDGSFADVAPLVGVDVDEVPGPYPTLTGGHTYGGDFGDIDNDGDMDFYMANLAHPRVQPWGDPSMFVVNGGPPDYRYANLREESGFVYDEGDVNAVFADYDNDMDLDLAIASLYTGHYSRLYRNDGAAGFTDVTYESNIPVHDSVIVLWSDVDEDGDLDLVFGDRDGRAGGVHLFVNRVGADRRWVELVLEGTASNRDGIGARVALEAGGVRQLREVRGGGGHGNQGTRVVHFGLGDETAVDSVTVRWVGGATETIAGVGVDGRYRVVEGSGTAELLPPG